MEGHIRVAAVEQSLTASGDIQHLSAESHYYLYLHDCDDIYDILIIHYWGSTAHSASLTQALGCEGEHARRLLPVELNDPVEP